jgi:uncharacterized protein (UPF0333 family)
MKAQVGLEYMVILAVLVAFMIPLFYIANDRLQYSRTTSEAREAMNTMVSTVNTVYSQSPGSRLTVNIFFPTGYDNKSSFISNRTIQLKITLPDGTPYEIFGMTKCNVTGRLPPYAGYHAMTFTLNQSGFVAISTAAK